MLPIRTPRPGPSDTSSSWELPAQSNAASGLARERIRRSRLTVVADGAPIARWEWALIGLLTVVLFVELLWTSLVSSYAAFPQYDLTYFMQTMWWIRQSTQPFSTIRGLYVLGDHAGWVLFPLGLLSYLVPAIPLLMTWQAFGLSAGMIPLYLLARRVAHLDVLPSVGVVLAYALYPATHNINMFGFHPEAIVPAAFLAAVWFSCSGRWKLFALCIAVILACREDMAAPVIMLGLVLAWKHRTRAGLITAAVALVVGVADVTLIMPHFTGGGYTQTMRYTNWGPTTGDAVIEILTHPAAAFDMLTSGDNAQTLRYLFYPVLLICIFAPTWLLPGIVLQTAYMLSNVGFAHTVYGQYTAATIPFVFVAMVMAFRNRPRALQLANNPVALMVVLIMSCSIFYHAGRDYQFFVRTPELFAHDSRYSALMDVVDMVGPHDSVVATTRFWIPLAERAELYEFPAFYSGAYLPPKDPKPYAQRVADVDWLLIDTGDDYQWQPNWRNFYDQTIHDQGFVEVYDREGITAYHRG